MLNKNAIKIKTDQIKGFLDKALKLAEECDRLAADYGVDYYSDDLVTSIQNAQTNCNDFMEDVNEWEPDDEDEEDKEDEEAA